MFVPFFKLSLGIIANMTIEILTLFPEYFQSPLKTSLLDKAQKNGYVDLSVINIRDFSLDAHKAADDRPYGGGPGMVMQVEPIDRAVSKIDATNRRVILLSAQGSRFTQADAERYKTYDHLVFICGHYEGVDERVVETIADEEKRIGDFVMMGGEPAALAMTESVVRLLPGVLGNPASPLDESHSVPGSLGFPQYTRPADYKGKKVPEVLLNGNHAEIALWRENNRKKFD